MNGSRFARGVVAAACVLIAALTLSAGAAAKMQSTRIAPGLCETTGGGKFVDIPGFPGETIDRRLLTDIRWLQKRYPLFITDGYSRGGRACGQRRASARPRARHRPRLRGRWHLARDHGAGAVGRARAKRARQPFRWVGYDGDSGHGRGHHLHISWSHSVVRNGGKTARTVYTMRCPKAAGGGAPTTPDPPDPPTAGGTQTGDVPEGGGRGGSTSGGIAAKRLAPPVVETSGADRD